LIIKPSALGDIVHALPVLPSLRTAFPQVKLTWLVRKEFAPLFECVEGLDDVIQFDRKNMATWFCSLKAFRNLWDFARQLRKQRFDLVLDLQGLFRSALFARMTNCKRIIGLQESRELAHLICTECIPSPPDSAHILDTYFAVLTEIGVQTLQPECPLKAPKTAQQSIQQKMNENTLSSKQFLVLIPGSAHMYKCWPTERFARLASIMHEKYGWPTVVVGTKNESGYAAEIIANISTPVIDLTGQTTIPELIALFNQAAAVVSNDTGPGHIALSTDTPGVIIFGNTNPLRLGPYNRPECSAAVNIEKRGAEIKDSIPAHKIENVTLEMVLEKINSQL
jgi:lipopolysaccharide heptosyltransferase I